MGGIGHNNGPTLDQGHRLRTFQWRRAQRALMPNTIPLQIVRMRMRRARELGMDYKTYAKVRQASGHDILALLFSSNALRIIGDGAKMPADRTRLLEQVTSAGKLALVHAPQTPARVRQSNPVLDVAGAAPKFTDSWSHMRDHLVQFVGTQNLASNRVLIIGDTSFESEWQTAAKAAGYLPAERYFAPPA